MVGVYKSPPADPDKWEPGYVHRTKGNEVKSERIDERGVRHYSWTWDVFDIPCERNCPYCDSEPSWGPLGPVHEHPDGVCPILGV